MQIAKLIRQALLAAFTLLCALPTWAVVELEGVQFEDTVVQGGAKLQLSGVGLRKRGYFKTEVVGMYTSDRARSAEAIYKTNAVRYMKLVLLRDIPSATASRYFVNDFKQVATDAEFKQLITDLGLMGGIYGTVTTIKKGDVLEVSWVPGKGMMGYYNGRPVVETPNKNELFWQVYMRMWVGPSVPSDFREAMLGGQPGS